MVWKGTKMLAKIFYVRDTESDETARCFDYECVASETSISPTPMFNVLADVGHQFTQLSARDRAEGMLATEISKKHPDSRSIGVGDVVYFPERNFWFVEDLKGWRQVRLAFVKVYLKTVSLSNVNCGLDALLDSRPDLKGLG